MPRMWRAARALTSCGYPAFGGASSHDEISNNLNNINDLKFYHEIGVRRESVMEECRKT